jgi:transcriptional regulator with XRE-family HTH domain
VEQTAPSPTHTPESPPAGSAKLKRRRELASFLRSRRERLAPIDVGLPPGYRRRTPGLRREEVAQIAGVGVTWYTWLEQGRPINTSAQVLEAVSRALQLDDSERSHLFRLAGVPDRSSGLVQACAPAVREIVDALHPYPALLMGPRYDVLAWNRAAASLMGDFSTLPARYRNIMWLLFTQPAWQELIVDRDHAAYVVALFRATMAEHLGEATWVDLVNELCSASPAFAQLWARHDVAAATSRIMRFLHPTVGLVCFTTTSLRLSEPPGVRIIAYTPADEYARGATRRLAALDPLPIDWVLPEQRQVVATTRVPTVRP